MHVRTAALVGVAGGAGTTRTAIEVAGVLARAGRSVLVLDLDFATQGLSQSVRGRIEPDATALLTDPDLTVADAAIAWDVLTDGRLDVIPAFAPFVDVAEAKSQPAAERVGDRLREATGTYDHVLVDVPPVVANQAIAGVDAVDRVAAVLPPTDRGVDSLQRTRGRLEDIGTTLDVAIATQTTAAEAPPDVDAAVPDLPAKPAPDQPTSLTADVSAVDVVADTAGALFDVDVAVGSKRDRSVLDGVRKRLS